VSWIVGLDLRDERAGVIRFACWLKEHGGTEGLVGVHVVERADQLDDDDRGAIQERAAQALRESVGEAGAAQAFDELRTLEGESVEKVLHAACVEYATEGLIAGRRVGLDEQGWVRLGATVRRLSRQLPAPLFVVAHDLDPGTLGDGPIVVAVTPDHEASLAAYRFADAMARRMGRGLMLVRVAPALKTWSTAYASADVEATQRAEQKRTTMEELAVWMEQHRISAPATVLQGKVLESLLAFAEETRSPLLVVGRSKATAVQRYFGGGLATELATFSRAPVAVVAQL
jgi:nucleotide-binding universal stress UspA family protein